MKALAVVGTLALGILLAGSAHAGVISSVLPGSGIQLGLPSTAGLYTALGYDLPRALIASSTTGAIQIQPKNPPPKDMSLTINVNKDEEAAAVRAWYLNPVWMAIGGLGFVLGLILVIMAARSGGAATTVVRG